MNILQVLRNILKRQPFQRDAAGSLHMKKKYKNERSKAYFQYKHIQIIDLLKIQRKNMLRHEFTTNLRSRELSHLKSRNLKSILVSQQSFTVYR